MTQSALQNPHPITVLALALVVVGVTTMPGVCAVKDFFREDISREAALSQATSYAASGMFYLPSGTIHSMVVPFASTVAELCWAPRCYSAGGSRSLSDDEMNRLTATDGGG